MSVISVKILSRLRPEPIMYGIVMCLLLYVTLFMFMPSVMPTAAKWEHTDGNFQTNDKATKIKIPDADTVLNLLVPEVVIHRMKSLETNQSEASDLCTRALNVYSDALNDGSIWALKMIDASSKIPSGLFEGNLADLGAYDECVDISFNNGTIEFYGQHCLVVTQIHFTTAPPLASTEVLEALGNSLVYTFALCVPSSCTGKDLTQILQTSVAASVYSYINTSNVIIKFTVQDSDCYTRMRSPLDTAETIGTVVVLAFLFVVLLCTTVELLFLRTNLPDVSTVPQNPSKCIQILVAFSLFTNGKRLLDTTGSEGIIQVLHSLRFLSIAWVVVGHRMKFSVQSPLANLLKLPVFIKDWSAMIILNATLSVDVFFLISGILNTYLYMNVSRRGSKSVLSQLIVYLHRYIRLTPAYALMMLVTGTWLYRVGDGPLWNRLVGDAKTDCTSYWWSSLLYINNYYNPDNNCMMQSWYLAADMQLFWLSPLVLYPLWRWPRVGLGILVALVVLSILVPFLVAYIDLIKTPIPLSFDEEKVNREMAELYTPTHTKTISYVIGILSGYLIYLVKAKKITFRINWITNTVLWVLSAICMAWAVFGGHSLFQLDSPYNRWQSSLYIAFYRFFWSLGLAWFIVACNTGFGGFVNHIFSWKVFVPLGRLTYCIYLTHVAVILYGIGSMRQPQYFGYYEMVLKFLGEFFISTLLAAILSLTIESPIMVLEKIILSRKRTEETKYSFAKEGDENVTGTHLPNSSNLA